MANRTLHGTETRDMTVDRTTHDPDAVGALQLLPILRAAMARGEGPPAVPAWVRNQGYQIGRPEWNDADEVLARVLAGRLATAMNAPRGSNAATLRGRATAVDCR